MQLVEQLDTVTIGRLRKQGEFLLRIYRAEIAKDPTSRTTESSRSNVLAMYHTVKQMYGEAVVRDVANLVAPLQDRSSRMVESSKDTHSILDLINALPRAASVRP